MKRRVVGKAMLAIGLVTVLPLAFSAQQAPPLCADEPQYRQQDFTLGRWEVFLNDASAKKIADVVMEKSLKECAIIQTWNTQNSGTGNGVGVFTYSRSKGEWVYFWVADNGHATTFDGSLIEADHMRYMTQAPLPNGSKQLRHWSLVLQSDGTVRELAVATVDGKVWNTEYDLLWRRKD